jgi:NTE family protein
MKAWAAVSVIVAVWCAPSAARAECTRSHAGPGAPTAVILSGGGAKGAYEAGVIAVLAERRVPLRIAAGSSAGALSAAMLVAGRADRLEAMWRSIRREQVYSIRAPVFLAGLLPGWLTLLALNGPSSLLDPQPLRELISTSLDLERVRNSSVRLLVTATDLVRRETRVFDNQTVTVDALMAATAVPGAFPPVDVDGAVLVDGGLTSRAPVIEALEARPVGRALVVVSYAAGEPSAPPTTMRRALDAAVETAMLHQIRRDIELARLRNPDIDVQVLAPSAPLRVRPLEFDPEALARIIDLGRADASDCLRAWGD